MVRESRTLEYKQALTRLDTLVRTVVAFANGEGGRIVIGVEDRTLRVIGLDPAVVDDLLERIPQSVADAISPPVIPQVFERTIDNKEVVVIQVFPGTQKPYFVASEGASRGLYVRVGSHTRHAIAEIVEELHLFRSNRTYDQAPVTECRTEDLDISQLPPEFQSDKALLSLGALTVEPGTGKIHPTRGGNG